MQDNIFIEAVPCPSLVDRDILTYKIIAESVVQDLHLTPFIEQIRLFVDIEKPLFAVYVRFTTQNIPITFEDISIVKPLAKNRYKLLLTEEMHAPKAMKCLQKFLEPSRIHQIERCESEIQLDNEQELRKLQDCVVVNLGESRKAQIYDAIYRIIPIGFRVRRYYPLNDNEILTIASEDPILVQDVESIKTALTREPPQLDKELLKEIDQIPKDDQLDRYKPWKEGVSAPSYGQG